MDKAPKKGRALFELNVHKNPMSLGARSGKPSVWRGHQNQVQRQSNGFLQKKSRTTSSTSKTRSNPRYTWSRPLLVTLVQEAPQMMPVAVARLGSGNEKAKSVPQANELFPRRVETLLNATAFDLERTYAHGPPASHTDTS
jgi:hypothetical protein